MVEGRSVARIPGLMSFPGETTKREIHQLKKKNEKRKQHHHHKANKQRKMLDLQK